MSIFVAIPEEKEIELKTAIAEGFSLLNRHYDFSASLKEGILVSRNSENWLIFDYQQNGSLPISELQIEIDEDDNLRIENAEFQAIDELVSLLDGIVFLGGEIDNFLTDYSFKKIQDDER